MSILRNIPKRPAGSDAFHVWCQAVHDRVFKKLQFGNSPTVKVNERESSYTFDAAPAGTGGGQIYQAQIVSEEDDYLVCTLATVQDAVVTIAGVSYVITESGQDAPITPGATINVAKPFLLRASSYDGLVLPGVAPALATLVNENQRTLAQAANPTYGVDQQMIYPEYTAGALIYVAQPAGGTGVMTIDETPVPVTYLDINCDRRGWGTEEPYCFTINGTPTQGYRLMPESYFYTNSIA